MHHCCIPSTCPFSISVFPLRWVLSPNSSFCCVSLSAWSTDFQLFLCLDLSIHVDLGSKATSSEKPHLASPATCQSVSLCTAFLLQHTTCPAQFYVPIPLSSVSSHVVAHLMWVGFPTSFLPNKYHHPAFYQSQQADRSIPNPMTLFFPS